MTRQPVAVRGSIPRMLQHRLEVVGDHPIERGCLRSPRPMLFVPLIVIPPLLVIGHLVPKAIVQAHADSIVDLIANPLRLMSFVLRPIVFVVGAFAAVVTRATRTDRKKDCVTRDELALLIESEPETDKPEIGAEEREMIANVFELSEYKVGELMVPLSEISALEEDTAIHEAALEIADKQHSRMPIYNDRIDDSSVSCTCSTYSSLA